MNNRQNKYEVLIADYLAGECSPMQKAELEAWVSSSSDNYRKFMQAKNVWEVAYPAFDPVEIDVGAATKSISRKIDPKKPVKAFGYYWQRAAAVLLLPLLAVTAWFAVELGYKNTKTAYNEVFAPYGTRSSVDLPDGSRVWINTGSSLKYPIAFSGRERVVSITGEAFFDVEADPKHPFAVEVADGMRVVAKGTSFNINSYRPDETKVTLVTGKVEVEAGGSVYQMNPRQQFTYGLAGQTALTETNTYKWVSWKDGVIAFRDDNLSYVFERLGQLYNVEFDVHDSGIADYVYRATFRGETLDQILYLLEISAPIRFIRQQRVSGADNAFGGERVSVYKK